MSALLPSELPVLAQAQHHWIVLFHRPHPVLSVALLVLLATAIFDPNPMLWVLLCVLAATAYLRWQTWRAEWVILTHRRIIRVRGVPETTSSEASLRLDRISGAVLEQTVVGKILNYGTIELEAPGHPDVRNLVRIAHPHPFYLQVRQVLFGDGAAPARGPAGSSPGRGPGSGPGFGRPLRPDYGEDYITAPLPTNPPWSPPTGRRRQQPDGWSDDRRHRPRHRP